MSTNNTTAAFDTTDTAVDLIPYQPSRSLIVRPIARPEEMRLAIQEYEDLKTSILQRRDVQIIKGKPHIKKSGWLRIARAFGVTVHPVSEHYLVSDDGRDWGYEIVVRAEAPNGASMPGDGACWASEKDPSLRTRHNVRAHAYTRATNRAISNLVGGGDVSAEELTDYTDDDEPAAIGGSSRGQASAAPATRQGQPQQRQASPQQAKPTAATKAWNGLSDKEFRQRMNALGYRTVADVEAFLDWAKGKAEQNGISHHDAAYKGLEIRERDAAAKRQQTTATDETADDNGAPDDDVDVVVDVVDGEVMDG